eukprot:1685359-Pyramimonas_sp.AAC.1
MQVRRISLPLPAAHLGHAALILLGRQEKLHLKNAASGPSSLVHKCLCHLHGTPKNWAVHRRRGRPRQQLATEVYKTAQHI